MIDAFDYKEPSCALCGGREFYNPEKNAPDGRIPVSRAIEKLDEYLNKNDTDGARAHLEYWQKEAIALRDEHGELAITDELIGLYRKLGEKQLALSVSDKAVALVTSLNLVGTLTEATVLLNAATAYKAFGNPEKAVELYERTLSLYNEKLSENDVMFAGLYNNFALALTDLKRYDEAETYYKKAIAITKQAENGAADAAISYINLAHLKDEQNKPKDEIVENLFKAYELLIDESLPQNGYLAFVLSKCYPSYEYFGYDRVAKQLKEKSEELYARA